MDYNKLYILTFQLTTSQGGRQEHTIFHHGPEVFQLTTSQGGRPDIPEIRTVITNFNSRPRKEVDLYATASALTTQIFQLTTSQGGRQLDTAPGISFFTFQLTTSQGGRRTDH